ncbi:MAG: HNH endonuclease [Candidatus Delongbacteria bacterium]|jgi:hypothetical protein|nr:HNH endonuclease [Candidatus Delongbacteria bacterium]
MKCVFCKENSDNSKSIEHIIPESLGNKNAVLAKGIVCDSCNNYFGGKIEKDLLGSPFYKSLRSRYGIESKKGKIPLNVGYLPITGSEIEVDFNGIPEQNSRTLNVNIPKKSDFHKILNGEINELYIPVSFDLEKSKIVSRFLAKVGIEVVAQKYWDSERDVSYLITEELFDPIRNYARYGKGVELWDYHQRRIYEETEEAKSLQKIYEFNIWSTEDNDNALGLHLTIVLYGLEFTINLFEPSINRYQKWLRENDNKIPI